MTSTSQSSLEREALTLADVAALVGGRVEGDPLLRVRGVAPLDQAQEEEMGFLAQRRYLRHLDRTRAGALLVAEALASEVSSFPARVVVRDAHEALARILARLYPPPPPRPGIHPTAVLGTGVELGREVSIGPYAVLEEEVVVGERVSIGAHAFVGRGSRIGDDSVLFPQVVLYPGTLLGARVILHAGVRLGVDGFGYVPVEGQLRKIPQVGGCVVEDDVEIGANACIDRGSIGRTVVGVGSKLDNLIHLGHNVQVGRGVAMAAMAGVSGSTRIGDHAMVGGQAGLNGHIEIGAGARIGAQAGVIGDIAPGETVSGYPARAHREYLRAMGMVFKLPETQRKLQQLEERLKALEAEREEG